MSMYSKNIFEQNLFKTFKKIQKKNDLTVLIFVKNQ